MRLFPVRKANTMNGELIGDSINLAFNDFPSVRIIRLWTAGSNEKCPLPECENISRDISSIVRNHSTTGARASTYLHRYTEISAVRKFAI